MKVKAAPGVRVPKFGQPRKYITEDEAVEVPEVPYYRLRIKEGDLILVEDDTQGTAQPGSDMSPQPDAIQPDPAEAAPVQPAPAEPEQL